MFSKIFWHDALERAVKTFAQAILVTLSVAGIQVLSNPLEALGEIQEFGILVILAAGALGFVYSILTSIVSSFIGEKGSASLLSVNPLDTNE